MMNLMIKNKKIMTILLIGVMLLGIGSNLKRTEVDAMNDDQTIIALDAGHYFSEPGKRSPYDPFWGQQKREIQYNMDMVRRVEAKIKEQRPDIQIYLTNPNGVDTTRSQRAVNAVNNKADVLISLHMNAINDQWQTKINGCCVCINKNSTIGVKKASQKFIDEYSKDTGIKKVCDNGIYERGAEVGILNKGTQLGLPSILLEMEFMDSYQAYRNFCDNDYLDMVADSIANNIIEMIDDGTIFK